MDNIEELELRLENARLKVRVKALEEMVRLDSECAIMATTRRIRLEDQIKRLKKCHT